MSVENVREQIQKFLKSPDPEVLCIRGNWGTGKTYSWTKALEKAAQSTGGLTSDKYAYVSLFGLNSIEDVKRELIYQTVNNDRIGKEFDLKDVDALFSGIPKATKWASWVVNAVLGDSYSSLGASVMYLTVRKRLICIDDLERKGENLRIVDVLGLISQLKEDRRCKVVLLLNDEQLRDRPAFDEFLEKVVDLNLRFVPSPFESASIALDGIGEDQQLKDMVRDHAATLGIDNVRVIRKIFRTINEIAPLLRAYKPGVLKTVVASLVLFGWSHHQPELAPPLDFIRSIGKYSDIAESPDLRVEGLKKEWGPLLTRYNYSHTDEFDEVLMDGVINGYFDADIVALYATQLHQREEASAANAELGTAWAPFHDSFGDNLDELVGGFLGCFERNARYYSFSATIQVVDLLRRLEKTDESNKVFSLYAKTHEADTGAFDLEWLARFGQELPDDILAKVQAIKAKHEPDFTNDQLFLSLKESGFGSNVATKLAMIPVEEYVRVLTSYTDIRTGLTDYVNVSNPNNAAISIMNRAADALKIIAKQNPLNSARARTWRLIQWQESQIPADPDTG